MTRVSSRIQSVAGSLFAGAFKAIKTVRPNRPIHPQGIHLVGTLERDAGNRRHSGIPWLDGAGTTEVEARISRSMGLPESLPDILGLAVRFTDNGHRTDVLLASTGPTGLGRFILKLHKDATSAVFSSMMPYKSANGPVVVAARTIESPGTLTMERQDFQAQLEGRAWVLELHHATPLGPWSRFGTLTLRLPDDTQAAAIKAVDTSLRFDPVQNPLPTTGTYGWTRRLREPSYSQARRSH